MKKKEISWEQNGYSCEIFFNKDYKAIGFEIYLSEDADEFHAEGMIETTGMTVDGYDGCSELPEEIIMKLEELGYDIYL